MHDPHIMHDPPRRASNTGHGEAQQAKELLQSNSAPRTCATFWAQPNNALPLCVAQAQGLLSGYKSRGSPFLPLYLCTGSQSRARGHNK